MAKLTEVADIQYGYAFDSKSFTDDTSYPQLARIRDVKRGFSETFYKGEYSKDYVLYAGDLLVGMDGEFNVARWKVDGALLNQRVCKIVARPNTDEEYLRFILRKVLKKIEVMTSFVTVKHLSAKELNNIELDIPKYEEQVHRAKILLNLETLIDKRKSQLDKLDELVRARFVELFGDININDKNWDCESLKNLCTIVRGGSPRPIEQFLGGDIPWIKISDATDGDNIYLNSTKEYIIKEGVKRSRLVKSGSLIFANCGVSLGFARIITFDGCIHDGWLAMEDIDLRLDKVFLLQSLNQMTEYFREIAPAGTQPNLNTAIMKAYKQVIPPIELQRDFIRFVKEVNKSKLLAASQLQIHIYKTLTLL